MNRRTILAVFFGLMLLIPFGALYASTSMFKPCEGDQCRLCDLVTLGNNVITFLTVIGVSVGVLMISIGGFQLVLSQGNESAKEKAKSRIWNVVIGFVIVLTAYLMVNTVVFALTGKSIQGLGSCIGGNELSSQRQSPAANNGF